MTMMVIKEGSKANHYICPCCRIYASTHPLTPEEIEKMKQDTIETFYSEEHARNKGWVFTSHPSFCPEDRSYVAVCPGCASKVNWVKVNNETRRF